MMQNKMAKTFSSEAAPAGAALCGRSSRGGCTQGQGLLLQVTGEETLTTAHTGRDTHSAGDSAGDSAAAGAEPSLPQEQSPAPGTEPCPRNRACSPAGAEPHSPALPPALLSQGTAVGQLTSKQGKSSSLCLEEVPCARFLVPVNF